MCGPPHTPTIFLCCWLIKAVLAIKSTLGIHKPRLYVAYYTRTPKPSYHTGFLVVSPGGEPTTLYHVKNIVRPNPATGEGEEIWIFDNKTTRVKTVRLCGLMYIGKASRGISGSDLKSFFESVPLYQHSEWRCHDWVIDAMQVHLFCYTDIDTPQQLSQRLINAKIIDPLPSGSTPGSVWEIGRDYADTNPTVTPTSMFMPTSIVVCDTSGVAIVSSFDDDGDL